MAVTASNKKKTRLDFAAAIDEAVAPIAPEQEEVAQEELVEVVHTPATTKEEDGIREVLEKVVEQLNVGAEEDAFEEAPAVVEIAEVVETPVVEEAVAEETVVEEPKQAAPKKQPVKKVKKEEPEEVEEEPQDDLDALLTSMQTGRGVQKSVYLEEDVFKYIQAKCQKTNAKFSNVLNLLLRSAIKAQQKK